MPIPDLDENGLLPVGIHDCSLEEIKRRFVSYQGSDQRPQLFSRLQEFIHELVSAEIALTVLIDGSFTTDKSKLSQEPPNDIDVMVLLSADFDPSVRLQPFKYNVISPKRVKKRYWIDLKVAREGSEAYKEYAELYSKVRDRPDLRKGYLRLTS